MNAKAVFLHPKCESETQYHNMCLECQRAFDYNNVMKWHHHVQSQVQRPTAYYFNGRNDNGSWHKTNKRRPEATELQSKWISFPDGAKIKKLESE